MTNYLTITTTYSTNHPPIYTVSQCPEEGLSANDPKCLSAQFFKNGRRLSLKRIKPEGDERFRQNDLRKDSEVTTRVLTELRPPLEQSLSLYNEFSQSTLKRLLDHQADYIHPRPNVYYYDFAADGIEYGVTLYCGDPLDLTDISFQWSDPETQISVEYNITSPRDIKPLVDQLEHVCREQAESNTAGNEETKAHDN